MGNPISDGRMKYKVINIDNGWTRYVLGNPHLEAYHLREEGNSVTIEAE